MEPIKKSPVNKAKAPRSKVLLDTTKDDDGFYVNPVHQNDPKKERVKAKPKYPELPDQKTLKSMRIDMLKQLKTEAGPWDPEDIDLVRAQTTIKWAEVRPMIKRIVATIHQQ